MANSEMAGIDLECGGGETSRRSTSDENNQCFSDAEEGSCYSQFYSTYGDANYDDPEIGHVSRRVSSAGSDCSVDVLGDDEGKVVIVHLGMKLDKRDCRICQLSLVDDGDGDAIELGCCCKDDLAAAHKHCAETWFKIKGNKICEICNSIVSNLVVPNETLLGHGTMDVNPVATSVATAHVSAATAIRGGRGCINGHRLLNFILACLVFAFVISWLFHFNIPS
ncbi:uncharacterized protein LOC112518037 [Cynara cardunculus var. scolymus]|uniref:Zinc finger, RING-CH-type n=1 Tax=Cynara cardunculus var. scolymus TaxID=59895 RepID=A0A124SCU0_CYNCS|nr:uncharacterized protein LOC112518037 [Cynara cardunculus var. scolymus]KVH94840.1 Zinc finger, RING-CH-type [Cynara cardunculus var. scolymus]